MLRMESGRRNEKASTICLLVSCDVSDVYTYSKTSIHKQGILLVTTDIKWKDVGRMNADTIIRVFLAYNTTPPPEKQFFLIRNALRIYTEDASQSVCQQ